MKIGTRAFVAPVLLLAASMTCPLIPAAQAIGTWSRVYGPDAPVACPIERNDGGFLCLAQTSVGLSLQFLDAQGLAVGPSETVWMGHTVGGKLIGFNDGGTLAQVYTGENPVFLRLDSQGVCIWGMKFSEGSGWGLGNPQALPDGGIILSGSFVNAPGQSVIPAVARLGPDGTVLWAKLFQQVPCSQGSCGSAFVRPLASCGFIGVASVPPVQQRQVIFRLSEEGEVIWAREFPYPPLSPFSDICETPDGGFVAVGGATMPGPSLRWGIAALKLDTSGNLLWAKSYGESGTFGATSVAVGADGFLAIAGQAQIRNGFGHLSDAMFVLRTESDGNSAYLHTFGGYETGDSAYAVRATRDGGFILSGYTSSFSPDDTWGGVLLVKLDVAASLGGACSIESVKPVSPSPVNMVMSVYAMTAADTGTPQTSAAVSCGGPAASALASRVVCSPPIAANACKMQSPFRVGIMGMNLQAGIHLIVNGEPWPQVSWKSATRVILKGGAALKAKLPKDQTSLLTLINPDGERSTVSWCWNCATLTACP